jgi:hypothetical protein
VCGDVLPLVYQPSMHHLLALAGPRGTNPVARLHHAPPLLRNFRSVVGPLSTTSCWAACAGLRASVRAHRGWFLQGPPAVHSRGAR